MAADGPSALTMETTPPISTGTRVLSGPDLGGATVLVLFTPRAKTPNREARSEAVVEAVAAALKGAEAQAVVAEYHPAEIDRLLAEVRPQLVFNLAYGFSDPEAGILELQPQVAQRLERAGVRHLGSSASVQAVVQDKLECARTLRRCGISSPRCLDLEGAAPLPERALVKPRFGSCHRGIRIVDPRRLGPSSLGADELVQEFIDGPEFTVGVLGRGSEVEVLPPLALEFSGPPPHGMGLPGIDVEARLIDRDPYALEPLARQVFQALELRDYARIDFRVGAAGPVVLDVNALPNLHPSRSFFPMAAYAAGIDFETLVLRLAASALAC